MPLLCVATKPNSLKPKKEGGDTILCLSHFGCKCWDNKVIGGVLAKYVEYVEFIIKDLPTFFLLSRSIKQ
jgi:hypothetical protein